VAPRRPAGLPSLQRDVADLEATAATLLNFQPVIVPGLQMAGYAREVVLPGYPEGRGFVIAEAALRWRAGPC
jgi:hypothetical protein